MYHGAKSVSNHTDVCQITALDGLPIAALVTKAPWCPLPGPGVICIHGGPWLRDVAVYNPEVDWLAGRGCVVIRINFRGSTGYGRRFQNAGDGEWGGRMHDDVLDVKRWAVDNHLVDPARLAIYGGSYGGYEVLASLTFSPLEFACGVCVNGPPDLVTMIADVPAAWPALRALCERRIGRLPDDRERLASRSPLGKAASVKAPLLLVYGMRDARTNMRIVKEYIDELRAAACAAEVLLFEDEGHVLSKRRNKITFYRAIEKFLRRHLRIEQGDPAGFLSL